MIVFKDPLGGGAGSGGSCGGGSSSMSSTTHLRMWCAVSISFTFLLHTLHEVKTSSRLTMLKLVTVTSFSGFLACVGLKQTSG